MNISIYYVIYVEVGKSTWHQKGRQTELKTGSSLFCKKLIYPLLTKKEKMKDKTKVPLSGYIAHNRNLQPFLHVLVSDTDTSTVLHVAPANTAPTTRGSICLAEMFIS